MNKQDEYYQYTVLKYRHHIALGEVINLGVLVLLNYNWHFLYPKSLKRIEGLYKGLSTEYLMKRLESLNECAKSVNEKTIDYNNDFMDLVYSNFLPKDDSSLQFDKEHVVVKYSESEDKILTDRYTRYFEDYELRTNTN